MPTSGTKDSAVQILAADTRALGALLDNVPGFAFRCRNDSGWTAAYLSDGAEALLGYPVADFIGERKRSLAAVVEPEDFPWVQREIREALAARRRFVIECRGRTASGEQRWFQAKGGGVFEGESLVALEGFATDVTDRRRAEREREALQAQLQQAQKIECVGRLAGGVAHDFNNLLTVIMGYCDELGEQVEDAEAQADLAQIRKAGERARALTRQLLAFSRKQLVEKRRTNLNHVITDCGHMLERLIGKHIKVLLDLDPGLGDVSADPARLAQAVVNLAINARDAMAAGGVLSIHTRNLDVAREPLAPTPGLVPGPYVLVRVTDTGCGMDEETQKHIFEPFFTTKDIGQGSGLGLATVCGIVEEHGGHIDFDSCVGRGTVFRICLPRLEPEDAPAGTVMLADPAPESVGGTETVLLVEDDTGVRDMAQAFLRRYGYRVLNADTPAAALHLAASADRLDLVLSDVVMPELNGRELCRRIVALRPAAKVLFMSGYTGDILSRHGSLDDGVLLLAKPFSAVDLATKVREVLDGRADRAPRSLAGEGLVLPAAP
jgi:PAS domain S-box-containing protein